jgi:hypothetical protein
MSLNGDIHRTEVVQVSSNTHGEWFDRDYDRYGDDTPTDVHPVVQRPISVAALLKREGHDTPSQEGMTRRTLTGVAAGAVMVFSAAVGSLLLHHGDTPTGTLAGSANGDVLAADGTVAGQPAAAQPSTQTSTHVASTPAATPKSVTIAPKTDTTHRATGNTAPVVSTPATTPTNGSTSGSTASTQSASTPSSSTPSSSSSSSSTSSNTGGSTSSSTPSSSSSSGSTTTSNNGGLVGTVTGVVGDVTAPVFSWFGG